MNRFRLSDTTTLFIEEGDLAKADVDVIVNAARIAIDVAQAHAGRLAKFGACDCCADSVFSIFFQNRSNLWNLFDIHNQLGLNHSRSELY